MTGMINGEFTQQILERNIGHHALNCQL